jgi:transcriptional regulator with XRE-family HTH domain
MNAPRPPKAPLPKGCIWWKPEKRHPLHDTIGQIIKEQRQKRNWSLDDLHEVTSIAKSYLSRIEKGQHRLSVEMTLSLEAAFGMVEGGLITLASKRQGPRSVPGK